ncbi:MAG: type I restriction endonuclease subunit R [Bacteroidia bacterium]|nr:type I restriction endonuclease subunit R [Bacteroidia bacterium]
MAALEWLQALGYTYVPGAQLPRNNKDAVLTEELSAYLARAYPEVPVTARNEALALFTQPEGMGLDQRNHSFHKRLTQGVDVAWKDAEGHEKGAHLYAVDFAHPYPNTQSPGPNSFIVSNQVEHLHGGKRRIPDIIIYLNGLPLVLFELKNMYDESVDIAQAHNQVSHYVEEMPHLFQYNALTVISDGSEAQHGMYNSGLEWFAPWKSIDGRQVVEKHDLQLHTLIQGLFPPDRLLAYLRSYIFHEDHNQKIIKKGAKYHQFFGVQFAVESARKAIRPLGDGRIGVIWHTQGSGKSISMAIFSGILRRLPELNNPTIVVQVDRRDLDQQLYDNFVLAKDLVGTVLHADSTEKLRDLLASDRGGVIFTTIEKFRLRKEDGEEEHPILSERENIIVMADEAHRTQYGFEQGGYARNLRLALPNASFIGFTGTPVDSKDADTVAVFGETIHTYDIQQAVKDGATVPIYYEPKFIKLDIDSKYLIELDEVTEQEEEAGNYAWAVVEDAAGAEDRVKKVAASILEHFQQRNQALEGKAMVVCMSRRNCVKLYDELIQLPGCPEVAVVMTTQIAKDPQAWKDHVRTKEGFNAIKDRFRKPDDPLKIVIVRDMWLTGFDAPCVHTMYVDKVMKAHNLMQAIARTNRVFGDKPNGVVVDFIGIAGELANATKKYTQGGGKGKPAFDMDEAVTLTLTQLEEVIRLLDGLDVVAYAHLSAGDKIIHDKEKVNYLLRDPSATEAFLKEELKLSTLVAMCKSDPRIWEIDDEVAHIQAIRRAVRKVVNPPLPGRNAREAIKDLISKSIQAQDILDMRDLIGVDTLDISVLDERFLASAKEDKFPNIRIELMRRVLEDELKARLSQNLKRMKNLREELEKVLKRYHDNSLGSLAVIQELIRMAQDMQAGDARRQALGLEADELAFYDILEARQDLLAAPGPIREIVLAVVKAVKSNLQLDWTRKEDAKAAIRLAVKRQLRKMVAGGGLDDLLKEIMAQAEGQYGDWRGVG